MSMLRGFNRQKNVATKFVMQ
jgi:hypothetical protein